jgi:hypothetical protein
VSLLLLLYNNKQRTEEISQSQSPKETEKKRTRSLKRSTNKTKSKKNVIPLQAAGEELVSQQTVATTFVTTNKTNTE